jgi:hypothetical protein
LDTGHHAVGLLFGLIKSRNRLAHTVEYYVERPSWDRDSAAPLGQTLTHEECAAYAAAVDTYFGAVLSGPPVLKGRKPWNHQLVVDAEPEREEQKKGEQNAGQVSSEAAQSAPPDEPSA